MELRPLTEGDAAAFQALWRRALREHPEAFGISLAEEEQRSLADEQQRLRTELSAPDSFVLGAFEADALVGIVTFRRWTSPKFAHMASITGMYVAGEMQGRGIARALLREVIARAEQLEGLEHIRIAVVTANAAARTLYHALGFVPYGIEPRALKVEDAYYDLEWMQRRLG